jgi:hypothetical protein
MKKIEAENPHFGAKSQMDSMKWWITVAQETLKGQLHLKELFLLYFFFVFQLILDYLDYYVS